MALSLTCTCGKSYSVDENLAGKRVKCKACGATLTVPATVAANTPEASFATIAATSRPLAATAAMATPASAPQAAVVAPRPAAAANERPPEFFLAHLSSALGGSQIYRAYVDADAVHFVHLGPYTPLVDLELARRLDPAHWVVKLTDTLKLWVVAASGGALAAVGVLGLALSRAAFREPSRALELVSFILAGIGLLLPVVIFAVGSSIWRITRRVRQLEGLSAAEIRQEAAKEKSGVRLAGDNVQDVRIEAIEPGGGLGAKPIARLSFKHQPSGHWKLLLYTPGDAKLAASALRRIVGAAQVAVDGAFA